MAIPAAMVAAVVIFATSASPSGLTPESVLAQVQTTSSVSQGQVEIVTATTTFSSGGSEEINKIYTNGQWFYNESSQSWIEKNGDDLTLTSYQAYDNYGQPGVLRALNGDRAHYSGRADIDSWLDDPIKETLGLLNDPELRTTFVPCEGCAPLELPIYFAGGDLTLTLGVEGGEDYYYITSDTPSFSRTTADEPPADIAVTRTVKIRARDYRLIELSGTAHLTDGHKTTRTTKYDYAWVNEDELSIPTSLAEWFALVDPDGRAEMSCHVYSAGLCNGGVLQQSPSDAPPYYIPDGWLDFKKPL
jgi:hypothetical protein